jgi:hypothetical protein
MGRIDTYRDRLLDELRYCHNCQPWENGVVWILGDRIWLSELVDSLGIPPSAQEEVVSGMDCPHCGSSLDLSYEVGVRHQYEIEHERRIERAERLFSRQLLEFSRFIEEYPYLGVRHPVGRKIFREMAKFPTVTLSASSWFRARRMKNAERYSIEDMRPPNPEQILISDGRFNHSGNSHWYLASVHGAAIAEVVARNNDAFAWVQEWRIEKLENVLDLRAWDADGIRGSSGDDEGPTDAPLVAVALIFGDHLRLPVERETRKPEYIVPRFIADAARLYKYSGILFSSVRHHFDNLVIFDLATPLTPVGKPRLIDVAQMDEPFPEECENEVHPSRRWKF